VAYDLDATMIDKLKRRASVVARDAKAAVELLWECPSVAARFDRTGGLTSAVCTEIGLVGVAARACGVTRDVRQDFPEGIYRFAQIPVSTWHSGDVFARAYVRWLEIQRSLAFVEEQLDALPTGPIRKAVEPLQSDASVVALTEGWRGEICHVATTDATGHLAHYKLVDPSFHNWFGLSLALRNQQISDFPLCNKSFNLSYCGHDL
jgi:Ni,Fe-hydrogenase III large subunit